MSQHLPLFRPKRRPIPQEVAQSNLESAERTLGIIQRTAVRIRDLSSYDVSGVDSVADEVQVGAAAASGIHAEIAVLVAELQHIGVPGDDPRFVRVRELRREVDRIAEKLLGFEKAVRATVKRQRLVAALLEAARQTGPFGELLAGAALGLLVTTLVPGGPTLSPMQYVFLYGALLTGIGMIALPAGIAIADRYTRRRPQ